MSDTESEVPTEDAGPEASAVEDVADAEDVEDAERRTVLKTRGLTKHFGAIEAVKDVSLDVRRGEILAIAGDNGAGKSTYVKMLSGVLRPTAGEILVRENGTFRQRHFTSSRDAEEAGVATVYQEQHLTPTNDAASNIFLGFEPRQEGLRGTLLRNVDKERMVEESSRLLNEIGFDFDPRSPIEELSGGQKQAVAVARALIRDPPIIILDEPTSEVSTTGTDKIIELVKQIPEDDKAVVLISHKIDVLVDVADRIAVMRDGELVDTLDVSGDIDRMDIVSRMHKEREI
ncbi:ATP-binding cassette domain-containing protein [Halococcus agarilyticus]|uniref:ATP-binding cassette domain-containing protein n=1 Tax=Halococcus agarilyticus TaxID=1232219 RepID=UPI000677B76B|nr:ATP-binding cassette domain-containing protein [Halococcus agarilyticus]